MLRISATSASWRNRGPVTRRSLASSDDGVMSPSTARRDQAGDRHPDAEPSSATFTARWGEGAMTEALPTPAARVVVPRWLDARVAVGLVLVLVSVAAGARIVSSAGHLTRVYAAAHELVPGEQLAPDDVAVVQVRLGGGGLRFFPASGGAPGGLVVHRGGGGGGVGAARPA